VLQKDKKPEIKPYQDN